MEEQLKRYFELRDQIEQLKTEQKAVRVELKASVGNIDKMDVYLTDMVVRLQQKSRLNRRCDWSAFKAVNEELYGELVVESTSEYLDIRKVNS